MNAYKLHGQAGRIFKTAVVKELRIPYSDIYKALEDIKADGTIITKDGKEYELVLKEKK